MTGSKGRVAAGRGAATNPPNRFQRIEVQDDFEQLVTEEGNYRHSLERRTEYYVDQSQSILSENHSPDIPFRYSLNPYRGCAHGCSYCYARPTHEYLGMSAGLDFETKVLVKFDAPRLLRDHLSGEKWKPETIMFSGVTDCYQPAERHFRLTRQCLEVAWEARQPVCLVTKNALIARDLDLLSAMASCHLATVALSLTTLDPSLSRSMEPRTSTPAARLRTIGQLAAAGVPTMVMMAPVIPGLNDAEIPAVLKAASETGAVAASYTLLRLPLTVRPVFLEWLERTRPDCKSRIEGLIRSTRGGRLNQAEFGTRMRGGGELARQIQQTFEVFAARCGLARGLPPLDMTQFRPPRLASRQLMLF